MPILQHLRERNSCQSPLYSTAVSHLSVRKKQALVAERLFHFVCFSSLLRLSICFYFARPLTRLRRSAKFFFLITNQNTDPPAAETPTVEPSMIATIAPAPRPSFCSSGLLTGTSAPQASHLPSLFASTWAATGLVAPHTLQSLSQALSYLCSPGVLVAPHTLQVLSQSLSYL